MSELSSWDKYFFEIAKAVSSKSKCLSKQYGAIIVNKDKIVISTGFNGTPFGVLDCEKCPRLADENYMPGKDYDSCRSIHAEENAIVFAGREKAKGGVMYLYGPLSPPCVRCKRLIINVGIERVLGFDGVVMAEYKPEQWVL